jgi:hypothetical protein
VYIRYTMPALPMLVAASMLVVREVSFGKAELALMALSGAVLTTILTMCGRDVPIFRQIVVLVGPLVFALAALVMVSLWRRGLVARRVAALSVALVSGVGFGIGLGHDLRANILGKAWINARYHAFARITPEKFAVFGYLGPMENALGTRASRDVQYGDLFQVNSWERVRPVLDYWFDEGRPVFFVTDDPRITSPWPDVSFEYVDREQRYYKVTRNKPIAKP